MADDFFAPPPFKPEEALQRLRRDLRELGLQERGGQFERRGQAIVQIQPLTQTSAGAQLDVALVRTPARSPQWTARTLKSSADVRDFVAACKKLLAQHSDRDEP